MKNRVEYKKVLLLSIIFIIVFITSFIFINKYQYSILNKDNNTIINNVISKVKEEYPNISDNEILDIMNNKEVKYDFIKRYGIDNNSIIKNNDNRNNIFIMFNCLLIILLFSILVAIFIIYDKRKSNEINKITKYIEEINKKNYSLDIDEVSEDELSILKNEIYKVTIMLKEDAENSKNEKKELKNSLSNISHQIKTPLTSMLIIVDNLIDNPDMDIEIRKDFIRDLKREIINVNFFIQSILKLSKLDANTVTLKNEDVSIKDIVDNSIIKLDPLRDLKNIDINFNVVKDSIIKTDFKWQVEAISNIINNSIEHSKDNSKIDIKLDANKLYATLSIRDYGCGISDEDIKHIFERFYTSSNSSKDSYGIGLSLSKSIIEKSNGQISVKRKNDGTEFSVKYFF